MIDETSNKEALSESLVSVFGALSRQTPVIFTCEHAGRILPPWVAPTTGDNDFLATHNGYDIGISDVVRELVRLMDAVVVSADFSRLICDTNRDWYDPSCIRTEIDGNPLSFNQGLNYDERARRKRVFYDVFHRTVDDLLIERMQLGGRFWLVSMHSFTPVLGDDVRTMELGIAYDQYVTLAQELAQKLNVLGFKTALNKPYSGYEGMVYSVARHGNRHRLPYLELEIRQDLINTTDKAVAVARRLIEPLRTLDLWAHATWRHDETA